MSTKTKLKYQHWDWIIGSTMALTILLSYFSIKSLWAYGPEWWTFRELGLIVKAVYFELIRLETYSLELFYSELVKRNWLYSFLLLCALPIVMSAIVSYRLCFKIIYKEGGIDNCIHLDGPKLYFGKYGIRHAKSKLRKQLKQNDQQGLKIHDEIAISKSQEQSNILAFGSQGSGKSVFFKPIVAQLIEKKEKCFIYDSKREYTPVFLHSHSVLVNPTDSRSHVWSICEDVTTPEAAQLIANCFLHEEPEEKFWVQGARIILTGCFVTLLKSKSSWSWGDLRTILNCEANELKGHFKTYYPEASKLIEEDSKTTQGFLSVIATQLT